MGIILDKFSKIPALLLTLVVVIILIKMAFFYYDLWRYPNVSLDIQPTTDREAASLVKTIMRSADCDIEELGSYLPGAGFVGSHCDKKIKTDEADGKLGAFVGTYFTKEQRDRAISESSRNYPFILVGEYYTIESEYWDDRFEKINPQRTGWFSLENESLLSDFPRILIHYNQYIPLDFQENKSAQ